MPYTLITSAGKVMTFYILGLAETYRTIHGGVIVDKTILQKDSFQESACL